jgi:hypothetical protein
MSVRTSAAVLLLAGICGIGSALALCYAPAFFGNPKSLPVYSSGSAEASGAFSLLQNADGVVSVKTGALSKAEYPALINLWSLRGVKTLPGGMNPLDFINIERGRWACAFRYSSSDKNTIHWLVFALDKASQETTSQTLLLHHVTGKTLRQRRELQLLDLGWNRAPVFAGNGIFWTGPRVFQYLGGRYLASLNPQLVWSAAIRNSIITWITLLLAYVGAVAVATGISRSFIRELLGNLCAVGGALLTIRFLMAAFYADILFTMQWLSLAVGATLFLFVLFLCTLGSRRLR